MEPLQVRSVTIVHRAVDYSGLLDSSDAPLEMNTVHTNGKSNSMKWRPPSYSRFFYH